MLQTRLFRIAVALALTVAAVVLVVAASASLRWRYMHDSPLMIYTGLLVAGGSVPYRDFFDMNMPGTYFVMAGMGVVFGWNNFGFRVFDLILLASISFSTFLWMRRFGILSARAASIAFPLWYLNGGAFMSMQREYIALVPFAGLLAVATADARFTPWLRTLIAGCLTGMASLIKPQFFLLSLPLLPLLLLQPCIPVVSVPRRIAAFVAGLSIPIGAMFVYLLWTRSLGPFIDIALNYWPLYTHLTGSRTPISGFPRFLYIVESTKAGLSTRYAAMAVIGLLAFDFHRTERRDAWLIGGILVAAALYPAVSGQFWTYHWMPFYYMALCAASLPASVVPIRGWRIGDIVPAVAVIFLLLSLPRISLYVLRDIGDPQAAQGSVSDEVFRFLRSHMSSEDAVQPLDWTGGAVHGMLMARAPLATRFMYDFHFYHHISNPYIGKLRREFMNELVIKKPRFIIDVFGENKPWPNGADTTRHFPELQAFLEQHYRSAQQDTTYRILQRID